MADDVVRAEVNAVLALKHGVESYSERVRGGLAQARSDLDAADRKAQEAVERRRSEVRRCEQELHRAEATLRQCQENCGGLQQAVAKAAQSLAAAKQRLDRARKGAQLIAEARSGLAKTGQNIESVVGQHSSVASAALGNLEGKLRQLSGVYPMIAKAVAGVFLTKAAGEVVTRVAGGALGVGEIPDPGVGALAEDMVESLKHGAEGVAKKFPGKD